MSIVVGTFSVFSCSRLNVRNSVARHRGQLAVVQVHDRGGVPDQRRQVAGHEHLAVADAEDQRGAVARDHHPVRVLRVEYGDGVRSGDPRQHVQDGSLEGGCLGARYQVGDDLGVGLGGELDPLGVQALAQRGRVVDDAVVHDADPPVLAGLRVGILLGGRAVGGPAGVPDADLAGQPPGQRSLEVTDAADPAENLGAPAAQDRDPGRVVSPVLQPGQALDAGWARRSGCRCSRRFRTYRFAPHAQL